MLPFLLAGDATDTQELSDLRARNAMVAPRLERLREGRRYLASGSGRSWNWTT